jgi:hypothetical protein
MHESSPHRGRLRSVILAGGLALGFTLLGAGPALAAPTAASVSLTATPSVSVGDTVALDLGLLGTTDIYAYDVTLTFDPAVLAYVDGSATGPTGGFDSVEKSDGSVTLVHSRLGTSPALSGDLAATASFTAVGSGSASIDATAVSLVDETGETTALTDAATASVDVAAIPTPDPTSSPTPDPTSSPTPTAGAEPAGNGSTPTSSQNSGSLATTGFSVGGILLAALAAVAVGLFALRRKKAVAR